MPVLPSLTALRCLDLSARHASFTKAAEALHLTQGAVSHQILGLEQLLGAPLFERRRGGLALTSAGQAYLAEIAPALQRIERATHDLITTKGSGGVLNLSVASSFGAYWLIPRLSAFVTAHPEIRLNLATHVGPVDWSRATHDAAIEFCAGAEPGLAAQQVLPLVVTPYAAPRAGRQAALRQLLNTTPLIRVASAPDAWARWLSSAGLAGAVAPAQLTSGPQYDLLSMALNGAIAGLGVALLPDYAAAGALAAGQLRQLSRHALQADKGYYLRCPEWKAELVAVRRFREWLASLGGA